MDRSYEHVLVTGGLGFIGSRLCSALASAGRQVVCVDDLRGVYAPGAGPDAARGLRARGVRVIVEDAGAIRLPRVDAIVHLAALPGVRTDRPFSEIRRANTSLTERLLASAGDTGARFLLASTSSVYGNARLLPTPETCAPAPLNAYAASKLAAERAVTAQVARGGVDALSARMFTVYGPGQRPDMAFARWAESLSAGRPLRWCAPERASRDFTYVDDAVAGLIAALDHGRRGEAYNVSGGAPVALSRALALLEELTARPARLDRVPASIREARITSGCGCKSAEELGYRPTVDLDTGLRIQLASRDGATPLRRRFVPARALRAPSASGRGSRAAAPESEWRPRPAPPAAATSRG